MTARYMFNKDFKDLIDSQKIAVYKYLNPGQTDQNARPAVPSKGMS